MTEAVVPLTRPALPSFRQMQKDFQSVIDSGKLTTGPFTARLEERVCELTRAKNCVAVSSGTTGLMLVVRALGLRGEVILPSFTSTATGHAVVWNGLRPVFCDVEPRTGLLDPTLIEKLISKETSALMPVHAFGLPCDIEPILDIARRHGLKVIFDSAQALGATYVGQRIGSFGNAEVFSLSPSQVVTSCEDGLITTDDDSLAAELRQMRDYGKSMDGEDIDYFGLSARLSELSAIVGIHGLELIDETIRARAERILHYKHRLRELESLRFQELAPDRDSACTYFVIFVDEPSRGSNRDRLKSYLTTKGIATKKCFYPCLHQQRRYRQSYSSSTLRLPVSERLAAQGLALPLYSDLRFETIDKICAEVAQFLRTSDGRTNYKLLRL